jgi:hypothetical protein
MTKTEPASNERRSMTRQRINRAAVIAVAALGLSLVATVAPARADTYIDPNDRCLPGADAPQAPVSDYGQIAAVHQPSVDCVFAEGIALGQADGTFGPLLTTTRAQMASFVVRALHAAGYTLPASEPSGFTDIAGNAHEADIEQLATIGVVHGTSARTYSPDAEVRRDQMASFLVRAAEFAFADVPGGFEAIEGVPAFTDVPSSNVHYDNVNSAAKVLGLADGQPDGMFNPSNPTARQQMATFLTRLVDMILIVD